MIRYERWKRAGRSWRQATALLSLAVALPLLLPAESGAAPGSAGGQPVAAPADTTITIHTQGSNLEFSPSRISAKQGIRLTIRYVNEGTLPHNIVLVRNEDDIDALGLAAFQASDTDYVPLQHEDKMIAHSALAKPGETVEMTFEVPPAGSYMFVCLYPGHYNMMVGTLRSLN